jgi:iron complex outermembrane receptor protein
MRTSVSECEKVITTTITKPLMKEYLLLSFTLLGTIVYAQTGKIKGIIKTSDQQPAPFVNILIKGTTKGVTTDQAGQFEIRNVNGGNYILSISSVGHEPQEIPVEVIAGQTIAVPEITLSESSQALDEVIVNGTRSYKEDRLSSSLRLTTPLIETSQNIQIVTGKVLSDQQVISMSDGVIRNVSGANRVEHWGDLYTNISMRGSQIQAFRNGFNVVSSYWGPLTEDMSFVDHIEFVKGPAGFMLANGDPSGLYNVVTKKPTGITKGEASITLGSYDLFRTSLDLDGKLNRTGKLLYRLNVAAQNKNSFRAYEYNNRYSFAPVISYQIDQKTKLTAEYTLQHAKMSDVGSYYVFSTEGYATLPRNFTTLSPGLTPTKINDHSVFINLQHELNEDWKLTAQTSYFNYQQTGSSMWPSAVNTDGTMIRSVGIWDAKSEMTMAQVFLNGNIQTGTVRHRILTGLDMARKDYMADWGQSHALDSAGGEFNTQNPVYGIPNNGYPAFDRALSLEARALNTGGLINSRYSGFYVQDELGFFENRLRLTLAGRYTYVSQATWGGAPITSKHITPRLGLSYSVNNQTSVYALYDQAFLPQAGRLANGGKVKPITGNNIEFGVKRDWLEGKWNTTLSVYRIIKNNELTTDPNSPNPNNPYSIEIGEKIAQGMEFDVRGELVKGLSMIANYAYTDAKVTKVNSGVPESAAIEGQRIAGSNKHTMNGWLNYKIQGGALKGIGASGGFTYMLDRATQTYSTTNKEQNLPDYFRLDGGLFWEGDKMKVAANVFNLLDKYLYSGAYYTGYFASPVYSWQAEAPRNYRLSISYKF